jgi:hypothetical protein
MRLLSLGAALRGRQLHHHPAWNAANLASDPASAHKPLT